MFLSKWLYQKVFLSKLGVPIGARKCCYSNSNHVAQQTLYYTTIQYTITQVKWEHSPNGIHRSDLMEEIQFPGILMNPINSAEARTEIIFPTIVFE